MTANVENYFDALLEPIDGLENVLKEVSASPLLKQPRMLFVRFREHEAQTNEFVELLSDHLVDYAIPLTKRQQANAQGAKSNTGGSMAASSRLRREAIRLLVKYSKENSSRYGEIGELISYVIAVHFLRAGQVGAKMALKTSSEMPIHGADGLHARANDDGTVTFFLLESKITPSAADASREMVDSVSEFQADRGRRLNELRLVSDLSNLEALQGEQREAAKSFFNVYSGSGNHLKRRDIHVGSLVFSEEAYSEKLKRDAEQPITIHEDHFESQYVAKHPRFQKNLTNQAAAKSLDLGGCIVFLVAVPDVYELKRIFAELNNEHICD
ncbi:DUF1837 domain-containing protein [Ectopseudomonas mendocina]|nr:DUF1837 domain-containing protein [Pseudomonas mendocina]